MNFFSRRRLIKSSREVLRHARHVRNMREDLMSATELARLAQCEASAAAALCGSDAALIEKTRDNLYRTAVEMTPRRSLPGLRENLEVFAVAIAVAMAFRTYFLQPFKIPTGSMEPTLYGIQVASDTAPGLMDRFPLKLVKWLGTGTWYNEIAAKADGYVSTDLPFSRSSDTTLTTLYIGGRKHNVPSRGHLRVRLGEYVKKGTVLWSGQRTAGDHVLVDKVRWNFRPPRRGEVMVFSTADILGLQKGTHYIKRMCGLPGERVSIHPPNLIIDGKPVAGPEPMVKIQRLDPGYAGYVLVDSRGLGQDPCPLASTDDVMHLGPAEYLALGDNTRNSRDGRYWGPVPQANLVGPACIVYWPFSARWGLIR